MSTSALRALALTCIYLIILAVPVSAYMVAIGQEDAARANMPVTRVSDLAVGIVAKVSGTMQSHSAVVLYTTGSGDTVSWQVAPFNVSDAWGTISVDPSGLQGSGSFREIASGIHDGAWWSGDAVAVIGSVTPGPNGTAVLRASYIARTPSGFAGATYVPLIFIGMTLLAAAGGTGAASMRTRRVRLHETNAPRYSPKTSGERVCRVCGAPLDRRAGFCSRCGALTNADLAPPSSTIPSELTSLRFGVKFSQRDLSERLGAVGLGVALPIVLVSASLWLLSSRPANTTFGITAMIFGIGFAVLTAHRFFLKETVDLGPTVIDVRRGLYHASADPKEVSRVVTVHARTRYAHGVETKGGQIVFFGPGLTRDDFERARGWLQSLARIQGIQYQDSLEYADLVRILQGERRLRQ